MKDDDRVEVIKVDDLDSKALEILDKDILDSISGGYIFRCQDGRSQSEAHWEAIDAQGNVIGDITIPVDGTQLGERAGRNIAEMIATLNRADKREITWYELQQLRNANNGQG